MFTFNNQLPNMERSLKAIDKKYTEVSVRVSQMLTQLNLEPGGDLSEDIDILHNKLQDMRALREANRGKR